MSEKLLDLSVNHTYDGLNANGYTLVQSDHHAMQNVMVYQFFLRTISQQLEGMIFLP